MQNTQYQNMFTNHVVQNHVMLMRMKAGAVVNIRPHPPDIRIVGEKCETCFERHQIVLGLSDTEPPDTVLEDASDVPSG